nr:facilitated trehalose transporter Tret1-like [Dermacentor andersoni]
MEALRRMRPPAKGATPVSDPDSMLPCGHHVHAMLVACYGTLAAGTALGFASAAMASIERQSWYDLPRVPPQNRWIADSLFLGATVGALFSGLVLHMAGYRTSMLLSSAGLISSWICMALGSNVSMVLVGRVACGLFVGVVANCACLYIADVAPPAKRSTYGGLPEVATSAGILTAYSLAGFPWEVQAGGCALAAIPTLALQRYIIENPRWLLAQDRFLDADKAVMRLYGIDPPPEFRQHKGNELTQQQGTAASYRWPKETSDWALDKEDIIASWNGLLSVGLLVTAYSLGMCHVPVLLTGELIPLRLRYLTSSIVWASRWSLTFVLLHFDEDVISAFHNTGALLMLSVTVAVVAATAIALVPETEGRTLSEIERS